MNRAAARILAVMVSGITCCGTAIGQERFLGGLAERPGGPLLNRLIGEPEIAPPANERGFFAARTLVEPKLCPFPDHHHDCPLEPPRLGIYGQIRPRRGMLVVGVVPGSAAARMGLEPGDVILRINEYVIDCRHAYDEALTDALLHYDGVVRLLVDNVRARFYGHGRRFVRVTAVLDSCVGPVSTYSPYSQAARPSIF